MRDEREREEEDLRVQKRRDDERTLENKQWNDAMERDELVSHLEVAEREATSQRERASQAVYECDQVKAQSDNLCAQLVDELEQRQKVERERDELRGKLAEAEAGAAAMREAAEKAVSVIHQWHGMGMTSHQEAYMWPIYWNGAPEMKPIRQALQSSAGRDLLERVKEITKLLREAAQTPQKMQEMMEREGFVIDNLDDRWQKLAFTLYAKLAAQSSAAKGVLEDIDAYLKEAAKSDG